MTNKHYVTIDENNLVTDVFSTAFRVPADTDICINENGGRHLQINGTTNPQLKDEDGFCLFKWDGTKVVDATQDEQPETKSKVNRASFKTKRKMSLDALTVTTASGKTFDADETSQTRMLRALQIAGITGQTETKWTMADNSVQTITVAEMQEAFALAMNAQSTLWFQA